MNNNMNTEPRDPWLRKRWQQARGAGKGDARRPTGENFGKEFDRIFGTCADHPDYKAIRKPTADCIVCRRLWREAELRRASEELQEDRRHEADGRGNNEPTPPTSGGPLAPEGSV